MPRLFIALPVPEEVSAELTALQSGVPDARWVLPENFHVTLCFAGQVEGGAMRNLEEELSDAAGPRFTVMLSGVEQISSGRQPRALTALVQKSEPLERLQQKVSTIARRCGIGIERRRFRPHVTLARFRNGAETGHHIAQFMASHAQFRAGPWVAEQFTLFSSRQGRNGSIYIEEAVYHLTY